LERSCTLWVPSSEANFEGGSQAKLGKLNVPPIKPCLSQPMTQISIDMPDDIAQELYRRAPQRADRVRLIEAIFREYFAGREKATELELLNANAEELNLEAEDVLAYQVHLEER